MTLTVRLPPRVAQELTEYCVKRRLTKSEAVRRAMEEFLRASETDTQDSPHPFIGGDKGDGSDVSGNIKASLGARLREERAPSTSMSAVYSSGDSA